MDTPAMSLQWEAVVVDATDPVALGKWWATALGWEVTDDSFGLEIRPAASALPCLVFVPVPESKQSKNRLHVDFRTIDQAAEVERLISFGARRADIGHGVPWVVLQDPEGNEFCVLEPRP